MLVAVKLTFLLSLVWKAWTLSTHLSAMLGVSSDHSLVVCCRSNPCRRSYVEELVRTADATNFDRGDRTIRWCSSEHAFRLLHSNGFKSTFAWFEDEILPPSEEELRKMCALNLVLRPPQSETSGSNANLLQDSLRCLSSSVDAVGNFERLENANLKWSKFLSLTSDVRSLSVKRIAEILEDVDAIEIRADRLVGLEPSALHDVISFVRSVQLLPIIFTVRSRQQLGEFPDNDLTSLVRLLQEGLRAGVAWLDVEASLPTSVRQQIVENARRNYPQTKLIGSVHDANPRSEAELEQLFHQADLGGHADVLKVVVGARGLSDCLSVHRVGSRQGKPYIGLCLGEQGIHSRVLNRLLTPVTHSSLPIAAPGQVSARDLRLRRERLCLTLEKKFYLFGSPIQQSLSPKMHNTAFRELHLPFIYSLDERSNVREYRSLIQSPTFGGASVTIPFKECISTLLDSIDDTAQAVGAVNTIVCRGKHREGHNTDWLGIYRPLDQVLPLSKRKGLGVVVGSGGAARAACFALQKLGLEVRVVGRNISKAQDLAVSFGGQSMQWDCLAEISALSPIQVIVSTVPAEAKLELPVDVLRTHQPVVFDVVYKPARTPLLLQARSEGCRILQGSTMLLYQGIEQFQLWCGVSAPIETMAAAVYGDEKFDDSRVN